MTWRSTLCREFFRFSDWLKAAAICVMKPEDLVAFTRSHYAMSSRVAAWSDSGFIGTGLRDDESLLLEKLPVRTGRLLLLGVGGGREAIPLAQMGFEVTGADYVPEMVARAKANGLCHGVNLHGLVQDISALEVPRASFDVIWFSTALYSAIPTRTRRIAMLHRMHRALCPQGYLVCQFSWNRAPAFSRRGKLLRQFIAWATFGNREFEEGDQLLADREFIHMFRSKQDLCYEFGAAGFSVHSMDINEKICMGGAILVKGIS